MRSLFELGCPLGMECLTGLRRKPSMLRAATNHEVVQRKELCRFKYLAEERVYLRAATMLGG